MQIESTNNINKRQWILSANHGNQQKMTIKMGRVPLHRGSMNVGLLSANHHNIKLIISENIWLNED